MKNKLIIVIVIVVLFILLVPIPIHLKDGGTVEYKALTYKISKIHKLNANSLTGYENATIVEILGVKIYEKIDKHMDYLN